jgi:hypothetical protein
VTRRTRTFLGFGLVLLIALTSGWIYQDIVAPQKKIRVLTSEIIAKEERVRTLTLEDNRLAQKSDERERAINTAESRFTPTERLDRDLRAKLSAIVSAQTLEPPRPARRPEPEGPHGEIFSELFSDPVYTSLYRALMRQELENLYGFTLSLMAPDPANRARLVELIVQGQTLEYDAEDIGRRNGYDPITDRSEIMAITTSMGQKIGAEIKELLGEDHFQQFVSARPVQSIISEVALRFSNTGNALVPTQAAELANVIAGSDNHLGMNPQASQELNAKVLAQAQTFLTPEQWEQLKNLAEEEKTLGAAVSRNRK